MSESVLPMFSSRSCIVSGLRFRSLIHFEFIFLYHVRKCSSFILLQVVDQFSQYHLLKRCSISLIIREMQIKTTVRYRFTPVRKAAIQKSTSNKSWKGCGEKGALLHCWWECKLVQLLWRTVWRFLKNWKQNCLKTQQSHCQGYTLRKPELKETCIPQCSLQHCL